MDPKRHSHVGWDTGRTDGRMLRGYYAIWASRTQEGSGWWGCEWWTFTLPPYPTVQLISSSLFIHQEDFNIKRSIY